MMAKVSVKGDDTTPLYQFLTDKNANPLVAGEIKWNSTKFLSWSGRPSSGAVRPTPHPIRR
jgi:glutathione peroxidase-family protein